MEMEKKEYQGIIDTLNRNIEIMLKRDKDEPWYYRFDELAKERQFFTNYKYDPRIETYFKYAEGVFHTFEKVELYSLFCEWGDFFNEQMSPNKINMLVKRYTGQIMFKEKWDPDPNIDNCLNGLVFKEEREIRAHSPDYPSRYQIQRNYISADLLEEPGLRPKLFTKMVSIIPDEFERNCYVQFLINTVHQYYKDELFCMFYGPRNGGKSTLMRLFESLYGSEIVSKTELATIGTKFGYEDLYDKRVNVNPDLPTIDLTELVISRVKLLTGNDGLLPVNVKTVKKFSYEILCFLVFGINQLMGFNVKSEKEMESIFRRVMLPNVPRKLPSDPEFKASTQDPKFLDQLYSWCVYMRPISIINTFIEYSPEDLEWNKLAEQEKLQGKENPKVPISKIDLWIRRSKKKWLENSNPILKILQDLFYYDEGMTLDVNHVQERVLEELDTEDSIITSKAFKTNVTQALSALKIYPNGKRGLNAKYINIAEVI